MTDDETKASAETVAMLRRVGAEPEARAVQAAHGRGHALVSQGCGFFRCCRCDERGFAVGRWGAEAAAFAHRCDG